MSKQAEILDLLREAMLIGLWIASPILFVALIMGILVGLLQALSGIQELTLTFVPKLFGIVATFWVTANFIVRGLLTLFDERLLPMLLIN